MAIARSSQEASSASSARCKAIFELKGCCLEANKRGTYEFDDERGLTKPQPKQDSSSVFACSSSGPSVSVKQQEVPEVVAIDFQKLKTALAASLKVEKLLSLATELVRIMVAPSLLAMLAVASAGQPPYPWQNHTLPVSAPFLHQSTCHHGTLSVTAMVA